MFSFFRKIRLSLFSQSPSAKYIIYATGEILLVVIGILIALQVNNWNQDRLDRHLSIEYHQRRIEDLDMMITFLEDVTSLSDKIEAGIDEAIEILERKNIADIIK